MLMLTTTLIIWCYDLSFFCLLSLASSRLGFCAWGCGAGGAWAGRGGGGEPACLYWSCAISNVAVSWRFSAMVVAVFVTMSFPNITSKTAHQSSQRLSLRRCASLAPWRYPWTRQSPPLPRWFECWRDPRNPQHNTFLRQRAPPFEGQFSHHLPFWRLVFSCWQSLLRIDKFQNTLPTPCQWVAWRLFSCRLWANHWWLLFRKFIFPSATKHFRTDVFESWGLNDGSSISGKRFAPAMLAFDNLFLYVISRGL